MQNYKILDQCPLSVKCFHTLCMCDLDLEFMVHITALFYVHVCLWNFIQLSLVSPNTWPGQNQFLTILTFILKSSISQKFDLNVWPWHRLPDTHYQVIPHIQACYLIIPIFVWPWPWSESPNKGMRKLSSYMSTKCEHLSCQSPKLRSPQWSTCCMWHCVVVFHISIVSFSYLRLNWRYGPDKHTSQFWLLTYVILTSFKWVSHTL